MRILFLDVRDAAGAQIARALYARRGGEARSAGERPADAVDEAVAEALEEVGLEPTAPHRAEDGDVAWADLVVRLHEDWGLAEPVGLCLEEVRELRAVIEQKVSSLPI